MTRSTIWALAIEVGYFLWLLFTFVSCRDEYSVKPHSDGSNIPIITNSSETFDFLLHADNCTVTRSFQLPLGGTGLAYYFSVSDYKGGTGEIVFRSQSGNTLILDTLGANQNISYGLGPALSPSICEINLRSLTATVTCRLRVANGTTFPLSTDTFPNRIGTQWRYERFDSVYMFRDTVEVTITSVVRHLRGGLAKLWQAKSSQNRLTRELDESYLVTAGDTIRIFEYNSESASQILEFFEPMSVGQVVPLLANQPQILVGIDTLSLAGGFFNQAYHLYKTPRPRDPDYECHIKVLEFWVQPKVGIVRLYIEVEGVCSAMNGVAKMRWELISYKPGG